MYGGVTHTPSQSSDVSEKRQAINPYTATATFWARYYAAEIITIPAGLTGEQGQVGGD